MVTVEQVQQFSNVDTEDAAQLQTFIDMAQDFVDDFLGPITSCPETIQDLAVMQAAARLWQYRTSPNGVQQFDATSESLSFLPLDPFKQTRALLRRYKPLGSVG